MKKKFVAGMCMALGLCGLVGGLAGCGQTEPTPVVKEIKAEEYKNFLDSEDVTSSFDAYTIKVNQRQQSDDFDFTLKIEGKAINKNGKWSMRLKIESPEWTEKWMNDSIYHPELLGEVYYVNNKVYYSSEETKYSFAYVDIDNSAPTNMKQEHMLILGYIGTVKVQAAQNAMMFKSLEEEGADKVKVTQTTVGNKESYEMVVEAGNAVNASTKISCVSDFKNKVLQKVVMNATNTVSQSGVKYISTVITEKMKSEIRFPNLNAYPFQSSEVKTEVKEIGADGYKAYIEDADVTSSFDSYKIDVNQVQISGETSINLKINGVAINNNGKWSMKFDIDSPEYSYFIGESNIVFPEIKGTVYLVDDKVYFINEETQYYFNFVDIFENSALSNDMKLEHVGILTYIINIKFQAETNKMMFKTLETEGEENIQVTQTTIENTDKFEMFVELTIVNVGDEVIGGEITMVSDFRDNVLQKVVTHAVDKNVTTGVETLSSTITVEKYTGTINFPNLKDIPFQSSEKEVVE